MEPIPSLELLTAGLLRKDDSALERRVCENEVSAKTYADAMAWLRRESIHLRKVAKLLDTSGGRLAAVLTRCQGHPDLADFLVDGCRSLRVQFHRPSLKRA